MDRQLVWADRTAQVTEVGPRGAYRGFSASPDGRRIAVHRHDGDGGDIFVVEPAPGNSFTRLTSDASRDNSMPIWSPDGKWLAYGARQKEKWGLYRKPSDGSGTEELLGAESEHPTVPMSWTPDGQRIVYWVQDPKTGGDLWVLPLEGDKKPAPFADSPSNETHAQVSPDGKWIAYTSNENTGRNEVWVRPFPAGDGKWQISNNGGDWPRWNPKGREIFYHARPDGDVVSTAFLYPLYAVSYTSSGAAFAYEAPREILTTLALKPAHSGGDYHVYDVSPDGQRFLLLSLVRPGAAPAIGAAGASANPDPDAGVIVALHWATALRKRK
jgi:Tol biopolymer transport system component